MVHKLRVIQSEALTAAQMHLAGRANVRESYPPLGLAAAMSAVPVLANAFQIMILDQCCSMQNSCAALAWHILRRQLLQQLVHELLAETQLPVMRLPF